GSSIPLYYAVQGFVSIFMPALVGVVADKWMPAQRLLGLCHLLAAAFMLLAWNYAHTHAVIEFAPFFTLYTLSVAFYMPTIALNNSVSFYVLKSHGLDTVKDFPPIRVLGTVGFIAAMWFVNSAYVADGHFGMTLSGTDTYSGMRFQYTDGQLLVCAILGVITALYACSMPKVPVAPKSQTKGKGILSILGLDAFHLFRDSRMFIFFIFSLLLGVALQITNGYATPFITSFKSIPQYADTFGANNATLLTSISQISEAFCILLIPFFLRRFGIKKVMLIAMGAWVLRFGFFGIGNPGDGLWLLILSMIVYGVAFDFFNVSGALFVEQETHDSIKASAQGLFMLMTNGLGASIGMLLAGAVVNHYVTDNPAGADWSTAWLIFSAYALIVAISFNFIFKYDHKPKA
ncbi:MAG: MFS transporter, partial [Muribaculum sp.]|nr:MFS transporter [Muribaculum sp.]